MTTRAYDAWLDELAALRADPGPFDPVVLRAGADERGAQLPTAPGTSLAHVDAGGVPAGLVTGPDLAADAALLHLHGGGYVTGSVVSHAGFVSFLAAAVGVQALTVGYRLAPEHPFPAAVEDAVTAWSWLLAQGTAPERVVVVGESAGAGLAVALCLAARDRGLPLPAGVVAMGGWFDLELTSLVDDGRDSALTLDGLDECRVRYVPDGDYAQPLASPVHADLAGLPPLLLQVGGDELLLPDSQRLAERVRAAGGDVKLDVVPGMAHVWQRLAGTVPEADEAVAVAAEWARDRIGALPVVRPGIR